MRFLIIGILLGFPALEGTLLYVLASGPTGHAGWVLAWLAFSAIAGIVLIKEARFSLVNRLASAFSQGQFSLGAFIDSFRTVLAGLLLIFPGVISDVMALLLLLIPLREPSFEHAAVRANRPAPGRFHPGGVIEGEFRRES
ncbi:MAG: FxsA family protein [Betaproteobacteria bacterium]